LNTKDKTSLYIIEAHTNKHIGIKIPPTYICWREEKKYSSDAKP
jgi:hypothetical protein